MGVCLQRVHIHHCKMTIELERSGRSLNDNESGNECDRPKHLPLIQREGLVQVSRPPSTTRDCSTMKEETRTWRASLPDSLSYKHYRIIPILAENGKLKQLYDYITLEYIIQILK